MNELTTAESFIVRIYRFDTEDLKKLTGLVVKMDGSESRAPFTDLDELAAIFRRGISGKSGRKKFLKK